MKRIKYACLAQTIHFALKDDVSHEEAVNLVKREAEAYRQGLDRRKIRYRVEEELTQPDGSILLRLRRQYTAYPCGDYLA